MPIGYFQIDNLIQQRIHFSMFSTVDLSPFANVAGYVGLEKMHLQQITTAVDKQMSAESFATLVAEKGLDKAAPIIIVCEDGEWSKASTEHLMSKGYINSFYALGGLQDLVKGP